MQLACCRIPPPQKVAIGFQVAQFIIQVPKRHVDDDWLSDIAEMEVGIREREILTTAQAKIDRVENCGLS